MKDKDKLVDFPAYNPDERVPFPPVGNDTAPWEPDTVSEKKALVGEQAPQQPYHQTYTSEVPTPDPSQTMPGAPNIRDPHTPVPDDASLHTLSPGIELKELSDDAKRAREQE